MTEITCKYFHECNAPLCPELSQHRESMVWYADEEVCKLRCYGKLQWIKTQRKIAKKTKDFSRGYFTYNMLNRNIKIGKAIKGINPDYADLDQREKDWIKNHSTIKSLTEKEKTKRSERMKLMRKENNV